jgi:hypothetical protein
VNCEVPPFSNPFFPVPPCEYGGPMQAILGRQQHLINTSCIQYRMESAEVFLFISFKLFSYRKFSQYGWVSSFSPLRHIYLKLTTADT